MPEHTCISHLCDDYFSEHNITPSQVLFRARPETLAQYVDSTLDGTALITRKMVSLYTHGNVKAIPLKPSLPASLIAIVNDTASHSRILKDFVSYMSHNCR